MENGQLTLVVLASVFVGAVIPMLIMGAIALYRAGREVAEIGGRLKRTLTQFELISERVEVLSRGFEGGETSIADLLAAVGAVTRGLERNMKMINILSAIAASVGPAVAAFINTRNGSPPVPSAEAPAAATDAPQ